MRRKTQSERKQPKFSHRRYTKSSSKHRPITDNERIVFSVFSEYQIGITIAYKILNDQYRQLIKSANGVWDPMYKLWKVPKQNHTYLRTQMPLVNPDILFEDPPDLVNRAIKDQQGSLHLVKLNQVIIYQQGDTLRDPKQNPLYEKLYPFQRQSLHLAIHKYGRLLIADEMGVGKTLQSLTCALMFIKEWPLLVICPSALKFIWETQIHKWLMNNNLVYKQQIQVLSKSNNIIRHNDIKILIVSYDIASKLADQLNGFKVVIADQAHFLKNSGAQRTQNLVPFLSTRKRIFLLTGTPALAKPRQLFNLLSIIRPDIYTDLKQFGERYCRLERNHYTGQMEYEGSRNSAQLHYILKDKVMVRRLKSEVLQDLPQKQRQSISLQSDKTLAKQIKELLGTICISLQKCDNQRVIMQCLNSQRTLPDLQTAPEQKSKTLNSNSVISRCYQLTGLAKLQSIKQYIRAVLENDIKVIIFAHHRAILDQLQNYIEKTLKSEMVRIDGSIPNQTRQKRVKQFQEQIDIRVALLSITCAGLGYTLTSASTVIFAELHWTPAVMLQAEDRAHRIGQKASVNIHYLLGENTIDHLLYRILQKKLKTVGQILDGSKTQFGVQDVEKGTLGRITLTNFKNSVKTQNNQKPTKITDYFPKSRQPSEVDSKQDQEQIIQQMLRKKRAQLQLLKSENQSRKIARIDK